MASNNSEMEFSNELSKTQFGNTLTEIKYVRNILYEIGPDPTDEEIDRAISLAKVDEFQDRMEKMYDPDMVRNKK